MTAISWLRDWVKEQEQLPECLRPQDLDWCKKERLRFLEKSSALEVKGSPECFLAWNTGAIEEGTQRPVALLWARQGTLSEVEDLLRTTLQQPMIASAFVGDGEWRKVLERSGFRPLRHFVTKTISHRAVEAPLLIRRGVEVDRPFFSALAISVATHTLPPGKKGELARYSRALLKRFLRLDYGPDSEHQLLIAENGAQERLGYLLLRLDDRQRAWVVDIGVDKSYWGQGVAQFLVLSAENRLHRQGYEFYVGEISAANERSLYVATELCGFSPNRELWIRETHD